MSDCGFGGVVRGLWLRYIDDGAGHGSDHHHRALSLAIEQMFSIFTSPEICAVDIDAPEFVEAVGRVGDGIKVFSKAGGGDQVVDFAMVTEDFGEAGFDGLVIRNVAEVGGNLGVAVLN